MPRLVEAGAVTLLLLLGTRRSETLNMRWADVDDGFDRLPEIRSALAAWGTYVEALVSGEESRATSWPLPADAPVRTRPGADEWILA